MEQLDVFDCSNVLIASYFADDRECAHENREHTLIYQCSGRLEIEERGKKTVLYPGDCAFMRHDNRMWLQKRIGKGCFIQRCCAFSGRGGLLSVKMSF